jgi:CO dehydrogenase maturation factor
LGIPDPDSITPICELKDLVQERTESEPGKMGGFFKMNPKVDDIPDKFSRNLDGIKLIVMGTVKKGGAGCICPESVMLKALMANIVLFRDEVVVMDMEAGIEHLGRATTRGVDHLIVVVEPGRRSVETAQHVRQLASDLGLTKVVVVGNKVRGPEDEAFLKKNIPDLPILGFLPYDAKVIEADLTGRPPYELSPTMLTAAQEIGKQLDT